MGILHQKLKARKDNIVEEINIYDSLYNVGPDFIRAGGGYIELVPVTDPNASRVKVLSKGKIRSLLKNPIGYEKVCILGGGIILKQLTPNIICRFTDLKNGFTALIKMPSGPYQNVVINDVFSTTSTTSSNRTLLDVIKDGRNTRAYIRDDPINTSDPSYKLESTKSLFEYPVRDDGISPMWDMNQIIYKYGYPIAKQIR